MPARIARHGRLNRNKPGRVDKALIALLDFSNGVYRDPSGNPSTLLGLVGDEEAYWYGGVFNAASVVAGAGFSQAAGSGFSFVGALAAAVAGGFTCVVDFIQTADTPNAQGLFMETYDAGAHNFSQGWKYGTVNKRIQHWEQAPGAATATFDEVVQTQRGLNRLVFTGTPNFSAVSVNGCPPVGRVRPPAHTFPYSAVVMENNNTTFVVPQMKVLRPCVSQEVMQALSRI